MKNFLRKSRFNKVRRYFKDLDGYLFVDPGVNTGLTFWKDLNFTVNEIKNNSKLDFDKKFEYLMGKFSFYLSLFDPKSVIIEDVSFRSGSQKSIISTKRGDIFKTSKIIGAFIGICFSKNIPGYTIQPHDWKGQMDSIAVNARIKKETGLEFKSQHIADSFGMSLAEVGLF